jgi:hypothetical protein
MTYLIGGILMCCGCIFCCIWVSEEQDAQGQRKEPVQQFGRFDPDKMAAPMPHTTPAELELKEVKRVGSTPRQQLGQMVTSARNTINAITTPRTARSVESTPRPGLLGNSGTPRFTPRTWFVPTKSNPETGAFRDFI